jgi:hypothetical protein
MARACIDVRLSRHDCVLAEKTAWGCVDVGPAGKTGPEDD